MSNVSFIRPDGQECPGFLTGEGELGIVVLQEWWGLNEQIKSMAVRFAEAGFRAIVPDLYRGRVGQDAREAGHLMAGLDWAGAVQDIRGAALYLKQLGCKKVGVTGFCMGGALSLASASSPEISAAIPYYGVPRNEFDASKITVPVQCHFGNKDKHAGFSDPETANALEEKLKAANVKYEFYRYEADHGFMNQTREAYDPEISKLAFERTVTFLRAHLQ